MNRQMRQIALVLAPTLWACSCAPQAGNVQPRAVVPILVQQKQLYPEAVTGDFLSLADFEDAPGGRRGFEQLEQFSVSPPSRLGFVRYIVTNTRSGIGAMTAAIPPGCELTLTLGGLHNLSRHTLLSLAVFSRDARDDLHVKLRSARGDWMSPPILLRPGWNNVLVDIRRLRGRQDFDVASAGSLSLAFSESAEPVTIDLDDVLLIDNARTISSAGQLELRKEGLDYLIRQPGREPLALAQCDDGLWRLDGQAVIQVDPSAADDGERIDRLGQRRFGRVEVLEAGPIRLRLASVWQFPRCTQEHAIGGGPAVRWEYTFYSDGRRITCMQLNNSGGQAIGLLRARFGEAKAAVAGVGLTGQLDVENLTSPIGQWSWLEGLSACDRAMDNYLRPPELQVTCGQVSARFDESQGCYVVEGAAASMVLAAGDPLTPLRDAAVRVKLQATGPLSVSAGGVPVRPLIGLEEGWWLFVLPGILDRPTAVEIMCRRGNHSPAGR